ncbi:hypothetical protein RHMOL_Rhmol01G0214000 [Rhododendron molle]|uniref:Uncharacterized protein n=1 Tax=Rhododendron molle TaxID=49168 RepID=A0ACC0Q5C5_RHOML|nr:hypothetical protein RHMOL_Rhmol01G0214000 [Rhododendron molle]
MTKQRKSKSEKTESDDVDGRERQRGNLRMTMSVIVALDLNCVGTESSCIDRVRKRGIRKEDTNLQQPIEKPMAVNSQISPHYRLTRN